MTRLRSSNLTPAFQRVDEAAVAETISRYRTGLLMRRVLRPLLMTILVTSLVTGLVTVVRLIAEDNRWNLLLPLLFFVALEAIYTTLWLKHPDRLGLSQASYRAAELFIIFILMRIVAWILFGEGLPDLDQILFYLRNPLAFFLAGSFVVTFFLALITWRTAIGVSSIFSELALSEYEIRFYSLPLAVRKSTAEDQPIAIGRSQLAKDFMRLWIWGGILLIVCTALSSFDLNTVDSSNFLAITRLGIEPLLLTALMLYFLSGFWLLSQARLEAMNARWLINGVVKDPTVERTWQRSSLLILLAIALVAAFMPIGSSFAFSRIVALLLYVLAFIGNLIFYLFALVIALFLSLLSSSQNPEQRPDLIPPQPVQPNPPPGNTPFGDTAAFVASSAFWSVFVVVAVMALLFFLRERRAGSGETDRGRLRRGWQALVVWLKETWRRLRHGAETLQLNLRLRMQEETEDTAEKSGRRWRFIRVNSLSPRDQLRYFYLSTVRRAGDQGVRREQSETPLEYEEDLKENWPETEDEVETLTDAFLKARYSARPISEDEVPAIKEKWKQVRASLREKRNAAAESHDEEE